MSVKEKERIDALANRLVEVLVNEKPSYYEALNALEIARLLLSNLTYPVWLQEEQSF